MGLNWSVEIRTSDTSQSIRSRQRKRLPTVLVTTPESLSVLISYADSEEKLSGLKCCIVDEWHELLSTKRGTQTELGLARLRRWNPKLKTWGLSATLGNLPQAADVLYGTGNTGVMVEGNLDKKVAVETLIPDQIDRFPWGGHMGLRMTPKVIESIESAESSLVFLNTRFQAEAWFKVLLDKRPDWVGRIALHHGSLDRKIRLEVEKLVREGRLKAVVCTSSLDLGVDFSAVDQVLQIGSPKGVGRLMQRAGRSGHRPGQVSKVVCVPTHAFELVEFSAAREGIEERLVEKRPPLEKPLDVLVQHLVTVAAGGGFDEVAMLQEVRTAWAYRDLTEEEWGWCLDFVVRGGPTLTAYPQFQRVAPEDGKHVVATDRHARLHRMGIGTITGDSHIAIALRTGKRLGTVEEQFISKLKPGDHFTFAGRPLQLVGVRQMQAIVKPGNKKGIITTWGGSRFPLSTMLAGIVLDRLGDAREGVFEDGEMQSIAPLLYLQGRWSHLPSRGELLIEQINDREGGHVFLYPFLGRLVHEGLGALIIHRIARTRAAPTTASFNDYGIELLSTDPLDLDEQGWLELMSPEHLIDDLFSALNSGELTRRQFRDISRVAGLLLNTSPGAPRSNRQLQASSELFFEVFNEFDPDNLLLEQARREVLEQQLEIQRLRDAMEHVSGQSIKLTSPKRLTPMAFPLWASRIQSQTVRVEAAEERIARVMARLEKAAG